MQIEPVVTADDLNQMLSEAAFTKIYGLKLHSFGQGECVLILPFQEAIERPGGIVAGPALMAAADVAMWLAIMTMLGKDIVTVTTEFKAAFLNSARREDVKCTARILKLGKSLIYGVAECNNMAGRLLTHHTITYIRLPATKDV